MVEILEVNQNELVGSEEWKAGFDPGQSKAISAAMIVRSLYSLILSFLWVSSLSRLLTITRSSLFLFAPFLSPVAERGRGGKNERMRGRERVGRGKEGDERNEGRRKRTSSSRANTFGSPARVLTNYRRR